MMSFGVFAMLGLSLSGAALATDCPEGQGYAPGTTDCTACAAGTWSAGGAMECTKCVPGKWSETESATLEAHCHLCAAGKANSELGASGADSCKECAPGKYAASEGSATCDDCAAGSWNDVHAAVNCTECAAGKFGPSGVSESTCQECAAGTYSYGGTGACTACPLGRYSTGLGQAAFSTCQTCTKGKWTSTTGVKSADGCTPTVCDDGTVTCDGDKVDIKIEIKNLVLSKLTTQQKGTLESTYAQFIVDKTGGEVSNLDGVAGKVTLTAGSTIINAALKLASGSSAQAVQTALSDPAAQGQILGMTADEDPAFSAARTGKLQIISVDVQPEHTIVAATAAPTSSNGITAATEAPVTAAPGAAPVATTTEAPGSSLPIWAIVLIIILGLGLLAAIIAGVLMSGGDKKKKSKKSSKKSKKSEVSEPLQTAQPAQAQPIMHEYAVSVHPVATHVGPVHEFATTLGPAHAPVHMSTVPVQTIQAGAYMPVHTLQGATYSMPAGVPVATNVPVATTASPVPVYHQVPVPTMQGGPPTVYTTQTPPQ